MKLTVNRTNLRLQPNSKKVIPRFFNTGPERSLVLINRVLDMNGQQRHELLNQVMEEFSGRYRYIEQIFIKHFRLVEGLLPVQRRSKLEYDTQLLIGSYFTMEYAFEAAALFNPSIVAAPDQSRLKEDEKRVILSFRATGESHLSSLIFKQGILDKDANIQFDPEGPLMCEGMVKNLRADGYELYFPPDSSICERVIFPNLPREKNGIEDARFVLFTDDNGDSSYIATYTAYDGLSIFPHLIETKDFCHFTVHVLTGKSAINKNLVLFPRKINGKYVMLSRIDGVNNYIMFSDNLYHWDSSELLQQPLHAWELVQIGNGGAPIETDKGWLVITHGVGPMRKYCLGASLFHLDDPRIETGRLSQPFLLPNEEERHGYVPNVVYTCGAMVHGDKLFLPYAVSDHATSFATVGLADLLNDILVPAETPGMCIEHTFAQNNSNKKGA